jgi:hypothetical protein
MTRTLTAAVLVVLLFSLGACGGSNGSGSGSGSGDSTGSATSSSAGGSSHDSAAVKAISDSLMNAQKSGASTSDLLSLDRKDADCIATGLVDKVGTAKLQRYGMLTKDMKVSTSLAGVKMSAGDADATTDVVFSCTDVEAMMQSAMARSGALPKQVRACVSKVMTEARLRPMFSKIFQGKQAAAQQQLTAPLMECAKKARP